MDPQKDLKWRRDKDHDSEHDDNRESQDDNLSVALLPPPKLPAPVTSPPAMYASGSVDDSYKPKPTPPLKKPSEIPYWSSITATITTSWTTQTKAAAYLESEKTDGYTISTSSSVTDPPTPSPPAAGGVGSDKRPPPGHGEHRQNPGGLYAAAAITPIVALTIIGLVIFLCLKKRKRRQQEAATGASKLEEMNMPWNPQSRSTAHPYIASPPPAVSPRYTAREQPNLTPPTSVQTQPIILGPIPSGVNGAYLTGIDTSDVISVTSDNNLRPSARERFGDNSSLDEPPPPYRPRSAAPPSFASNSRQSSFRATAPPATSQTHLIEHSPFDDPADDDAVSELDGPSMGRSGATMSDVSDLSYQQEPVVNNSSL